ncbi:four helix bundle protein [Bacteroides intestinalis]|jgi:four helix bundle protein|uniref:Four helix bundle protein n=1 Tax=Bacteroides intestinalis TaxID=329854 RepID=A0A412Y015_9BACE|nr:four helix bundle protein [Bacteroides intestinalis]RGV50657.1 four helix bundle protein [Bacteroides intestinalis]RHA58776.1 four helix bundle protein [Bacteroides intestinalis]
MKDNIIKQKSFLFAVRIIKLYKYLNNEHKEYVLSKQMLRSGTSIGANVREALNEESKSDFVHKLGIAQKEADETMYWLELLNETEFLKPHEFESMSADCIELIKLLRSIVITAKASIHNS